MSYQTMDHADWMQRNLDASRRMGRKVHKSAPEKLSEFQRNVVDILGMVGGGIYNAPINIEKIDWSYGGGISVVWQQKEFATFDYNTLTLLVFLCHDARIRCSVSACGPRNMRLSFWQRQASGDVCVRHPNLEEAVKAFRAYLPADHRIIFKEEPAQQEDFQTAGAGKQ
jgi:hypothetical protein